ncbi:MAG: tetratricopeptide repeat protein [Lachnospiraceae bacterium]|nr:tetratricopeptide repeat protein [Lachnospiraceae bacterium]
MTDCFLILEMEETKDLTKIKSAYYKKLKTVNPEDDPEGFKRLRKAYEEACEYAKQPDEEPAEEVDDTPSGQWLGKVKALYASVKGRQDLEAWKELFNEEVFLSLDEEEQCKEKLLIFLMNHIYLPTEIWRLMDDKVQIVKNSSKLQERFPKQFIDFCVYKCKQGENLNFAMFECEDDADLDKYLYYYDSGYRLLEQGDLSAAKQAYEDSLKCDVYHPVLDILHMHLLEAENRLEEMQQVLYALLEKYSDADVVQYQCGESLFKLKKYEEARVLYEKLKAETNKHYMANYRLADIYYEAGEYKKAKKCAEIVLEYGSDEQFHQLLQKINVELKDGYKEEMAENGDSAMEYGWCLIQNEEYFAGIKLARSIEGKVPESREIERKGLLAKLYVQEALYEQAAEMALVWRQGLLERLPQETGDDKKSDIRRVKDSYYLRIQAYHAMGGAKKEYYEEALKEIDQVIAFVKEDEERGDLEVSVYLERAQILLEMERYDECEDQCLAIWQEYHVEAVYSIMLKLAAKRRDAAGVVQFGEYCIKAFPQYIAPYEEIALVYLCLEKKEDMEDILKQAKEAEIKSIFLEAYEYQFTHEFEKVKYPDEMEQFEKQYKNPITQDGNMTLYEDALNCLKTMFYRSPSIYLLNEIGRFYMDTMHYAEAEEVFKKILSEQPYDQFALNNLGCIYKYTGRYEKAVVCFNKSIRYMDEEPNTYPYGNCGHTFERMGEYQQAEKVYRSLVERFPEREKGTRRDIVTNMARGGNLEGALALIKEKYVGSNTASGLFLAVDLCIELDNEVLARKYLKELEAQVNQKSQGGNSLKQYKDYLQRAAEVEILYGDYFKAFRDAKFYCEKSVSLVIQGKSEASDAVGDLADFLFYATLYEDALKNDMPKKETKKSFKEWFKTSVINVSPKFEDGVSREEYDNWTEWAAVQIGSLMERSFTQEKNEYFYQQKNRGWMVFMADYFHPKKSLNAAYQTICDGIMCRFCSENCCIEELTAQALVKEREGKEEEAIALYEALQKKNPFQIYARCKLRFKKPSKGSN